MKYLFIILVFVLGCNFEKKDIGVEPSVVPNKVITIESLNEMFDNISKNTTWNMNGPMLWGYFFTDNEKQNLIKAKPELEKSGYRFVSIFIADKDEPEEADLWFLHVEKIELHSPLTLDERNNELYIFAEEMGLDSYDGMDVGPVEDGVEQTSPGNAERTQRP